MNYEINNFDNKIYFLGFNKTATSTIQYIFQKNQFKAGHNTSDFNRFQIIADTGSVSNPKDKLNYELVLNRYPNSICVLNTRNLHSWLESRCRHYYWRGIYKECKYGYPISVKIIEEWIINRNAYYVELLLYFLKCPSKLLILDIDNYGWIKFLCNTFDLEHDEVWLNKSRCDGDMHTDKWHNKSKNEIIPQSYNKQIIEIINQTYLLLNVTEEETKSSLLVKSLTDSEDYISIYKRLHTIKNNIL